MSFADKPAEQATPATVTRVLSHIELVDLKCYADRIRSALARLPAAIHEGDTAWLYELCGELCSDLDGMIGALGLDSVEEPDEDDPQVMDASKWPANDRESEAQE